MVQKLRVVYEYVHEITFLLRECQLVNFRKTTRDQTREETHMTGSSTTEIIAVALNRAFSELDACFALPREKLESRPDRLDAWNIAQHLEHVCLANHFLLLTIQKGCRTARRRAAATPIPEAESDLELLAPIASPGAFDWPPPSHMLPTGRAPLSELRARLDGQRELCLRLLGGLLRGEGRLCRIYMSVNGLGKLDMYQWLYFLAQHIRFHLTLISRRLAA